MSTPIKGHLFKFKDATGNWHEIPILYVDIYNAYVQYCIDNNIAAVDLKTYYETIGELKTLTDKFDGGISELKAVLDSLGEGALPLYNGGLGVTIGEGKDYPDLLSYLTAVGVAKSSDLTDIHTALSNKLNISDFSQGTKEPNEDTPGTYYIQFEE